MENEEEAFIFHALFRSPRKQAPKTRRAKQLGKAPGKELGREGGKRHPGGKSKAHGRPRTKALGL